MIQKVIRVVNNVLSATSEVTPELLDRIIPSTVLLTVIHFHGMDDGPDFDFVLRAGYPDMLAQIAQDERDPDNENPAALQRMRWQKLLEDLKIFGCDDFEKVIISYLRSGLLDLAAVEKVVARYGQEERMLKTRNALRQLHEHVVWHWKMSPEQLLNEAAEIARSISFLSATDTSSFLKLLGDIPGAQQLQQSASADWTEHYLASEVDSDDDGPFSHELYPEIQEAIRKKKTAAATRMTVVEACERIAQERGWGAREEGAIKYAAAADFEKIIREAEPAQLKTLMRVMVSRCSRLEQNRQYFGAALDEFSKACRTILRDPTTPRLAALIRSMFASHRVEALLTNDGHS